MAKEYNRIPGTTEVIVTNDPVSEARDVNVLNRRLVRMTNNRNNLSADIIVLQTELDAVIAARPNNANAVDAAIVLIDAGDLDIAEIIAQIEVDFTLDTNDATDVHADAVEIIAERP